ncbi:hypothetical protein C8F04DRAFT_1070669 [Mycena alexandri]|uniref:Peptidase M20 dimerisation domain-containing protein n=1 Tax=Mycena alexandri TaxID=1745969 RepID=A0AAD6TDC0_9AGAR|nr:hypothetical protein C8F04DRAFT_1070669 [Mycena alexandri]
MVPHPSLSRNLWQSDASPAIPTLLHSLRERLSVLSLAASEQYIFCGSQSQDIPVWDKKTFRLKDNLRGHTGAVLALVYAEDRKWLFSSSGDSTVRIWSTSDLTPVYVLSPYLETGAGDLFSLAWSPSLQTIYVGCQNTSLQWYDFNSEHHPIGAATTQFGDGIASASGTSTPRKPHKFFDSYPNFERKPADIFANNSTLSRDTSPPRAFLNIPEENVVDYAHYGYIYCMALLQEGEAGSVRLATGSGDECVKIWECSGKQPTELHAFECNNGAIFSLVVKYETVYAGCQDGAVKVLDLETKTLVRTIIVQEGIDVLSLSMSNSDLYTCAANGFVQRFSASFDCTASWQAHNGIVLSSIVTHGNSKDHLCLITGGNDDHINVWELISVSIKDSDVDDSRIDLPPLDSHTTDTLTYALSKFISIPSVSSNPDHKEDCRQAAIWLKKCLIQLGAESSLLPTGDGKNPLVLGTFNGASARTKQSKPRILFYGHYDVISAPSTGWDSEPFHMAGRNGYLYGRGVTDNKGPILAVACAVANLLATRALGVDVVFLIEGEEECGSMGFGDAVRKHKDLIGDIDAILVSNSTWIAEDTPCITYGLRGVVHCALEISSDLPDLHSGIEGGAVVEPLLDMVHLLSTLTDAHHQVRIPGFYDRVRQQTDTEKELYKRLATITGRAASSLSSRWREPSLTVHSIEISGPKNATVIPGTIKSQVSLRIVPDQDLDTITKSLSLHLETSFNDLKSPNKLKVSVEHTADWWLGELDDFWFKALESAVQQEWGMEPLRIREGGTIPSVPFLEKEFRCHALHLPMGQSSDQAHLPNERISLDNLRKGKSVIERFLSTVGDRGPLSPAS